MMKVKIKFFQNFYLFFLLLSITVFLSETAQAQNKEDDTLDYLKSLSIEDLLQTQITSVSKKEESLFYAAAAITVITQKDIERTGARSIPEALRMVPGLDVASIDGSRYAIGSRGFNEVFETKLLVLIDGRSMYTPLFSGVNWQSIDTIMEDIDRIEVIRGPGATVWGANAVNGVINIITKNSADTLGSLISTTVGNIEQPNVSMRYGARVNETTSYRVYTKGYNRNNYESLSGGDANDTSQSVRAGFRMDSVPSVDDTFSLQGEVYDGEADIESILSGYSSRPYTRISDETETYKGGHLLASWEHHFSDYSSTNVQFYYDRSERDYVVAVDTRDTVDLELKHHWKQFEAHDIVWGAGFRLTHDTIDSTFSTSFDPQSRTDNLWNVFIQDDINLIEDIVWITLGSKFEHNDYSGIEIQPSVRFRVVPAEKHLFWAAVSRAVRTPSRAEHDITVKYGTVDIGNGNMATAKLFGGDDYDSEELVAYEMGYRWQVTDDWSLDIATYFNDYADLRSFYTGTPLVELSPIPNLVVPRYFANEMEGEAYGLEIQSSWQVADNLKIIGSYSYINFDLTRTDPPLAGNSIVNEDFTPQHQLHLRGYYDISKKLFLDTELYYVSDLGEGEIDSYLRVDLQLRWQAHDYLLLAAGVENLLDSCHQEFFTGQSNIAASEIPRQYWLKATLRF